MPAAVNLVGREMPDPIGTEFGMAADEIAYGATLEQAVERMAERCQHPDVDLFAATVRLQERTGGNLTGLLKLNANTVRDRHKMRLKIKAASSEGRASAMILTSAPVRGDHLHHDHLAQLLRRRDRRADGQVRPGPASDSGSSSAT